ncbi:MAG: hypothetical protein CFH37_01349 [Alphaproteobacteria bacterium MarineAlpha9_Bin7]|nr:MAG: hypothetical protein CFH37_01349 [Alphaproteobacteria bacterium MarineAlpha9_Bin7]
MEATISVVGRAASVAIGAWLLVSAATEISAAEQASPEMELRTLVEEVELVVSADHKEISISDQLTLRVTVFTPQGRLVAFPNISKNLGPFRVVGHTSVRPQAKSDMEREEWREEYLLEADSVGEKNIRAMTITVSEWVSSMSVACRLLIRGVRDQADKCELNVNSDMRELPPETMTVKTPPLTFFVTTVLADDADITSPLEIAPPVSLPKVPTPLWFWALCAGVCASVGLLIWRLLHRKQEEMVDIAVLGSPAHLAVLAILQKLRQETISGPAAVDVFYVRLSQVLRRYALWRFGISAPYQTTEELMRVVASSKGILAEHRSFVGRFFRHCDAVKFAQHHPTDLSRYNFIDEAVTFVTVTADDTVLIPSEEGKLS